MLAIINQGSGNYYLSPVFGFYNDGRITDKYSFFMSNYYVVFNKEKTQLIKWYAFKPDPEYIIRQIIIVDTSHQDWILDENAYGGPDFLPKYLADEFTASGIVPPEILIKCREADNSDQLPEYPEIMSESDVENLMWTAGDFHDAFIKEEKVLEDGTLYLLFDGIWGCCLEIWFWGDLEYSTASRDPAMYDPYWFDASVFLQDGFVYLIDEENAGVDDINEYYCWFKARHMKYHIIPAII